MTDISFIDRVAIVTGADGGLGKTYALDLASRGASVVVNDLGGSAAGEGSDASAARQVVDEIVAKGGTAVASHDSVSTPEARMAEFYWPVAAQVPGQSDGGGLGNIRVE